MAPGKSAIDARALPAKEAKLFKELLVEFENKLYKKGVKTADAILKKVPDHGETLCMKGIIVYNMNRKAEGFELANRGLRKDIKSHICWHVQALMHRADKDYDQSLTCYLQAHKLDKDNYNILRDLAALQIYQRQYEAALESRLLMLRLQPKIRPNWASLAVSYHLLGDLARAADTLRAYLSLLEEVPPQDYEYSETVLYLVSVLEEADQPRTALDALHGHTQFIVDKTTRDELTARLLVKVGEKQEGLQAWRKLLASNAENYTYLRGYLAASDLNSEDAEQSDACLRCLDDLAGQYPRSLAIRRLTLIISRGTSFASRVKVYLADALSKGVPSLYNDLKPLLLLDEKREAITQCVETFVDTLTTKHVLDTEDAQGIDPPTTLVWALYFQAQLFSGLGLHQGALQTITKALDHTPTLPELPMMKARILKRAGDFVGAEKAMAEARALDGQDRFLNCKHAKYLLRVDDVAAAESTAGLFTRKDAASPIADLIDMQAFWFLQAEAQSHQRQYRLNMALKRYHQIAAIFADIREDEFDFHSYAIRRFTLRAYVQLLRYEDQLHSHTACLNAVEGAVQIYLELADKAAGRPVRPEPVMDEAARDAERQQAKKNKKAEAKAKSKETPKKDADVLVSAEDTDPNGDALLATTEPLESANQLLKPLKLSAAKEIQTWLLAFDIDIRRDSLILAAQSLAKAHALNKDDDRLPLRYISLMRALERRQSIEPAVRQALTDVLSSATKASSPATYLEELKLAPVRMAQCVFEARGAEGLKEVEDRLFTQLDEESPPHMHTCQEAIELLELARSERITEYKARAAKLLPLSTCFTRTEPHVNGVNGHS
ncbi:uncharacterized protein L969DRAFT_56681 [Mixia osmundae IAM 14324]|uniref:Uncharacterized protein n=1 Tax=Mixia osmundae (strain CBS 9802 / IAM 14324 / JCM 22182 / KY 12970) TaxID=764103 RepID=G7E0B3_MIXOS|nr:uncharacterized protein L969DRAFT_56681 [Mixia osmundae IAM 14324]KEI42264.1 hypothetical protein L969DRAFT_56681 [Mixia osmundae IAM 14324]GAA96273.1 hypothetical protein E5Q_02938 [Mixia osmundae IAM 14324]